MARVALVVLVLALVAAAVAQTNSPPNVQGQWSDQACNLIPGSDQLYQNRTFFFSAVNTKTLDGTYELHQQLYNDASCTPSLEIMRVIEKGSFKLGDRANLERFWDIDYTVTSRSMQVFTSNFADTVNSYVSCKFPTPFVPNLQQDITSISCSEFNILSAGECPMIYDIVRRDGTTLYIGQRYPGNPPQFVPPCITVCRPADYDHFSLAKQATATPTPAQPTLAPNPNPGTGVIFNAGDALGPLELIELSSSELSANAASSLVASVVLVALVALAIAM